MNVAPASAPPVLASPRKRRDRRLALALGAASLLASAIALAAGDAQAAPAAAYSARILRDAYGIPHVYGDTDAAAAFGLGYAQAEDDMDSIEDAVLWSRGRLSAKLGSTALPQDRFSQMLQGPRIVRSVYDRDVPAGLQKMLTGYAAGVNTYLRAHPDEGRYLDRPVEAMDMAAFWYMITPLFFGLENDLKQIGADQLAFAPEAGVGGKRLGSNGVAVSKRKSTDGVTRLLANSHQPWEGMLAWYEAGVHSKEGLDFYGGSFAATPFPVFGHNAELGWTYTLNRPKITDTYRLELSSSDPQLYRYDGAWRRMDVYPATYEVKTSSGTKTIEEVVEWSVHGPVIRVGSKAYAIRYASIGQASELAAQYRMIHSHNFAQWKAAFDLQNTPATNTIYADRDGNVGYFYNAKYPDRSPAYAPGSLLPGDRPDALWTRYLPASVDPKVVNPASGYVFNGNNGPFLVTAAADNLKPEAFAAKLRIETTETNRGQRLFEQMARHKTFSRQDILDAKFDCKVSRDTRTLDDYLRQAGGEKDPTTGQPTAAAKLVADWNRSFDSNSPGASLATYLVGEWEAALWGQRAARPASKVLASAAAHLTKTFGTLDPGLGDLVRLRRGKLDLPVTCGGPDTPRAINTEYQADGRRRANAGDSLMLLIEWTPNGKVQTQGLNPYGQAMTRPDSPHYDDQAKKFLKNDFRPAWFYRNDVEANAVKTYVVKGP